MNGMVIGKRRADLVKQARETAVTYFDTTCVDIRLFDEQAEVTKTSEGVTTSLVFRAGYEARIQHRWDRPSSGFPKCIDCGKYNP